MPLTKLQIRVLRLVAAQRSPESYHDSEELLDLAVGSDWETLRRAGLEVSWAGKQRSGKRSVRVQDSEETSPESVVLEWVADSDFRFFPSQPDELFGYVLHPVDLATNKASAAADRREPRDIIDLLTIHSQILSLGAVITAAVGRFPGMTPEEMLAEITRHSRFTAEEFRVLATESPLNISEVHRKIRGMLEDAEAFIRQVPSELVGVVFLDSDGGLVREPQSGEVASYRRRAGSRCGLWPSSPGIDRAMLESYGRRDEESG